MKKIIFTTARTESPSFMFYSDSLLRINNISKDVKVEISGKPKEVDYSAFDFAFFMGVGDDSELAKKQNSKIITGVFDPRAGQNNLFKYTDFIVANGLESKDYFSKFCDKVIVYYTYPTVSEKIECPLAKDKLILGYHGNEVHLNSMYPRITDAIEQLNKEIPLELWAMYNVKRCGKWRKAESNKFNFKVNLIQYSEENYASYIAHTDIGLVPQFMPVTDNAFVRYLLGSLNRRYNERNHDFIFRFKETTNIGRHLVFAQYGIPVVSDMTPSACDFIDDSENSFLAYNSRSWYLALKKLAFDKNLRIAMGNKFKEKYISHASYNVQNQKLIDFLDKTFISK